MEQFFASGVELQVSRGTIIDMSDSIYLIKTGVIGQYSTNHGSHKLLFAFKEDEIFPMTSSSQSASSGRAYVFKALSKAILVKLPIKDYEVLIQKSENMQLVLECALRVMQHQIERINNLQEEQIMQRLLERLIYIALRFGSREDDSITIDIPMSHVDLATSINSSRETVNRYMKQLEQLGIITLRRQIIHINSLVEIQKMLEPETEETFNGSRFAKGLVVATLVASALLYALNSTSTTI